MDRLILGKIIFCFEPIVIFVFRVIHTDFDMGGDRSPPIGGGLQGGDKGPMGGD